MYLYVDISENDCFEIIILNMIAVIKNKKQLKVLNKNIVYV